MGLLSHLPHPKHLPPIPGVPAKALPYVYLYLAGGFATWIYIQVAYAGPGKFYWQGFGSPDMTSPAGQFEVGLQTIALWPVALIETLTMTQIGG